MPQMPQMAPTLASQTTLVNNLVNNQFSKTLQNLSSTNPRTTNPVSAPCEQKQKNENTEENIVTPVQVVPANNKAIDIEKEKNSPSLKIADDLDDLVDGFESSISLNIGKLEEKSDPTTKKTIGRYNFCTYQTRIG